jgi:voltage-gated potassium channel
MLNKLVEQQETILNRINELELRQQEQQSQKEK